MSWNPHLQQVESNTGEWVGQTGIEDDLATESERKRGHQRTKSKRGIILRRGSEETGQEEATELPKFQHMSSVSSNSSQSNMLSILSSAANSGSYPGLSDAGSQMQYSQLQSIDQIEPQSFKRSTFPAIASEQSAQHSANLNVIGTGNSASGRDNPSPITRGTAPLNDPKEKEIFDALPFNFRDTQTALSPGACTTSTTTTTAMSASPAGDQRTTVSSVSRQGQLQSPLQMDMPSSGSVDQVNMGSPLSWKGHSHTVHTSIMTPSRLSVGVVSSFNTSTGGSRLDAARRFDDAVEDDLELVPLDPSKMNATELEPWRELSATVWCALSLEPCIDGLDPAQSHTKRSASAALTAAGNDSAIYGVTLKSSRQPVFVIRRAAAHDVALTADPKVSLQNASAVLSYVRPAIIPQVHRFASCSVLPFREGTAKEVANLLLLGSEAPLLSIPLSLSDLEISIEFAHIASTRSFHTFQFPPRRPLSEIAAGTASGGFFGTPIAGPNAARYAPLRIVSSELQGVKSSVHVIRGSLGICGSSVDSSAAKNAEEGGERSIMQSRRPQIPLRGRLSVTIRKASSGEMVASHATYSLLDAICASSSPNRTIGGVTSTERHYYLAIEMDSTGDVGIQIAVTVPPEMLDAVRRRDWESVAKCPSPAVHGCAIRFRATLAGGEIAALATGSLPASSRHHSGPAELEKSLALTAPSHSGRLAGGEGSSTASSERGGGFEGGGGGGRGVGPAPWSSVVGNGGVYFNARVSAEHEHRSEAASPASGTSGPSVSGVGEPQHGNSVLVKDVETLVQNLLDTPNYVPSRERLEQIQLQLRGARSQQGPSMHHVQQQPQLQPPRPVYNSQIQQPRNRQASATEIVSGTPETAFASVPSPAVGLTFMNSPQVATSQPLPLHRLPAGVSVSLETGASPLMEASSSQALSESVGKSSQGSRREHTSTRESAGSSTAGSYHSNASFAASAAELSVHLQQLAVHQSPPQHLNFGAIRTHALTPNSGGLAASPEASPTGDAFAQRKTASALAAAPRTFAAVQNASTGKGGSSPTEIQIVQNASPIRKSTEVISSSSSFLPETEEAAIRLNTSINVFPVSVNRSSTPTYTAGTAVSADQFLDSRSGAGMPRAAGQMDRLPPTNIGEYQQPAAVPQSLALNSRPSAQQQQQPRQAASRAGQLARIGKMSLQSPTEVYASGASSSAELSRDVSSPLAKAPGSDPNSGHSSRAESSEKGSQAPSQTGSAGVGPPGADRGVVVGDGLSVSEPREGSAGSGGGVPRASPGLGAAGGGSRGAAGENNGADSNAVLTRVSPHSLQKHHSDSLLYHQGVAAANHPITLVRGNLRQAVSTASASTVVVLLDQLQMQPHAQQQQQHQLAQPAPVQQSPSQLGQPFPQQQILLQMGTMPMSREPSVASGYSQSNSVTGETVASAWSDVPVDPQVASLDAFYRTRAAASPGSDGYSSDTGKILGASAGPGQSLNSSSQLAGSTPLQAASPAHSYHPSAVIPSMQQGLIGGVPVANVASMQRGAVSGVAGLVDEAMVNQMLDMLITSHRNNQADPSKLPTTEGNVSTKSYLGHEMTLSEISKTQIGSRTIQTRLKTSDRIFVDIVLRETFNSLPELMYNLFGNYLIQTLIGLCTQAQRLKIVAQISSSLVSLACDKQGTRTVQKLIKCSHHSLERALLLNALRGNPSDVNAVGPDGQPAEGALMPSVLELMAEGPMAGGSGSANAGTAAQEPASASASAGTPGSNAAGAGSNTSNSVAASSAQNADTAMGIGNIESNSTLQRVMRDPNGWHVIQAALETFPLRLLIVSGIIDTLYKTMRILGLDQHGVVLLKKALTVVPAHIFARLAKKAISFSAELVNNQYGNYLMQHIVERGAGLGESGPKLVHSPTTPIGGGHGGGGSMGVLVDAGSGSGSSLSAGAMSLSASTSSTAASSGLTSPSSAGFSNSFGNGVGAGFGNGLGLGVGASSFSVPSSPQSPTTQAEKDAESAAAIEHGFHVLASLDPRIREMYREVNMALFHALEQSLIRFACQKFSSKVIERCLRYGAPELRTSIVGVFVTDQAAINTLLQDVCGGFIVGHVLRTADQENANHLKSMIQSYMPLLSRPVRKRWETTLQLLSAEQAGGPQAQPQQQPSLSSQQQQQQQQQEQSHQHQQQQQAVSHRQAQLPQQQYGHENAQERQPNLEASMPRNNVHDYSSVVRSFNVRRPPISPPIDPAEFVAYSIPQHQQLQLQQQQHHKQQPQQHDAQLPQPPHQVSQMQPFVSPPHRVQTQSQHHVPAPLNQNVRIVDPGRTSGSQQAPSTTTTAYPPANLSVLGSVGYFSTTQAGDALDNSRFAAKQRQVQTAQLHSQSHSHPTAHMHAQQQQQQKQPQHLNVHQQQYPNSNLVSAPLRGTYPPATSSGIADGTRAVGGGSSSGGVSAVGGVGNGTNMMGSGSVIEGTRASQGRDPFGSSIGQDAFPSGRSLGGPTVGGATGMTHTSTFSQSHYGVGVLSPGGGYQMSSSQLLGTLPMLSVHNNTSSLTHTTSGAHNRYSDPTAVLSSIGSGSSGGFRNSPLVGDGTFSTLQAPHAKAQLVADTLTSSNLTASRHFGYADPLDNDLRQSMDRVVGSTSELQPPAASPVRLSSGISTSYGGNFRQGVHEQQQQRSQAQSFNSPARQVHQSFSGMQQQQHQQQLQLQLQLQLQQQQQVLMPDVQQPQQLGGTQRPHAQMNLATYANAGDFDRSFSGRPAHAQRMVARPLQHYQHIPQQTAQQQQAMLSTQIMPQQQQLQQSQRLPYPQQQMQQHVQQAARRSTQGHPFNHGATNSPQGTRSGHGAHQQIYPSQLSQQGVADEIHSGSGTDSAMDALSMHTPMRFSNNSQPHGHGQGLHQYQGIGVGQILNAGSSNAGGALSSGLGLNITSGSALSGVGMTATSVGTNDSNIQIQNLFLQAQSQAQPHHQQRPPPQQQQMLQSNNYMSTSHDGDVGPQFGAPSRFRE